MVQFFVDYGFIWTLALFAVGALGALMAQKNDVFSHWWSSLFATLGSLFGVVTSGILLFSEQQAATYHFASSLPLLQLSFSLDPLATFFVFVISCVALAASVYGIGYMSHYYGKYTLGAFGFFYNIFIAGMLLVVTAQHGIAFLLAWELMSISSYFLIIFERKKQENVQSGFLYLIMTHAGTACILFAFLLLYRATGSFDFAQWHTHAITMSAATKGIIFVLALIGFGTKAGMIPFHIWLPQAHPAAPSQVSALMSGVMIKTGIYMCIRLFFGIFSDQPMWWGIVVLLLGSASALLGVLYALTEHDIKRLLAYHSIENIGIILLGIGAGLVFSSAGMNEFAVLAIVAALFHTMNHAVFKALLFFAAGSVVLRTHTRSLEEYGGLIKLMPLTALFFFVGAVAISALPPLNGFASEWITYQALFLGLLTMDLFTQGVFIVAIGSLAVTGGLAAACFVKAFGTTFLARPRSEEAAHATEAPLSMNISMGAFAVACVALGLFSSGMVAVLKNVSASQVGKNIWDIVSTEGPAIQIGDFSMLSLPWVWLALLAAACIVCVGVWFVSRRQKEVTNETWECGYTNTPRMEITSTAFARSLLIMFKGLVHPTQAFSVTYKDGYAPYFPTTANLVLGVKNLYSDYLYQPLYRAVTFVATRFRQIQKGNLNLYVLYLFVTLIGLLIWVTR